MSADEFAVIFFNKWYCENGLLEEIVLDCNKLFVLKFWKALTKIADVSMKMTTSFHPEGDSISERSNKTVNQSICYHIRRNQKGWVRALPKIHFDIMNSVNVLTGFSGFQLQMGRSPCVMPPIVPRRVMVWLMWTWLSPSLLLTGLAWTSVKQRTPFDRQKCNRCSTLMPIVVWKLCTKLVIKLCFPL